MKRYFFCLLIIYSVQNVYSQYYQELRWPGSTPYIDFSNDASVDFDMRMQLTDDHSLYIQGGNVGIGSSYTPQGLLHLKSISGTNYWSSYNFGASLVIDGAHHNSIGLLDINSSNPLAITNSSGSLIFSRMPSLGNTTTAPVYLMTVENGGNVGIGTGSAAAAGRLQVNAASDASTALRLGTGGFSMNSSSLFQIDAPAVPGGRFIIGGDGSVGIGTTALNSRLTLALPANTSWDGSLTNAFRIVSPNNGYYLDLKTYVASSGNVGYLFSAYGYRGIAMTTDGKVGIGTLHPDAWLTVNGNIHSTEVKVDVTVPGPDYVFEKDYTLPSLESVKSYIDQNKHLPEVPSAKEMEANGINLSEMNMLLLKKVEELTLYVIEMNKKSIHFQEENNELKNRIEILEKNK